MADLNFCPYCEAPSHKLMLCKDGVFFCKLCSRFFKFAPLDIKCDRCKGDLKKSDFDSPQGGAVFFCVKCKRTFPASEIVSKIK